MLSKETVDDRILELKDEIKKLEWHISLMRKKGIISHEEATLKSLRNELKELYKRQIQLTFR